jgi:TP901 family phage tail tape measure protein
MSVNIRFDADVLPVQRGIQQIDRQMSGLIQSADRVSRATSKVNFDGVTKVNTKPAISSVDQLSKSVHNLERQSTATSRMVRSAFVSMAASISAGFVVNTIADFGSSMSKVQAITRATGSEFNALRSEAARLGATTEFTASQAAEGLSFLGMAGFSAAESLKAIPQVLDLATAAQMDLGRAADISSNIMSAFEVDASNAAHVTDLLAAASSRANTDVEQLGSAISYAGPVAKAFGISMSDTAAAIGVLSDAGIQGTRAGTGLRRSLGQLAKMTPKAEAALNRMGVSASQVNPATVEFTKIIETLARAGLDATSAFDIFGDIAAPAMLELTSNVGNLTKLAKELSSVEGEAKRMADTMRDNLRGDIQSLTSAVAGLFIGLGDAGLEAALRSVVQTATSFIRTITAGVEVLANFGREIAKVFRFLMALSVFALSELGVFERIGAVFESLRGVIASMNFTDLFSQLTSIEFSFDIGKFKDAIEGGITSVIETISSLNIASHLKAGFDAAVAVVVGFVNRVVEAFLYLYNRLVGNSIVPDMARETVGWFGYIVLGLTKLWEAIQWFVTRAASRFKRAFDFGFEANEVVQVLGSIAGIALLLRSRIFMVAGAMLFFRDALGLVRGRVTPLRFAFSALRVALLAFTFLPDVSGFLSGVVTDRTASAIQRVATSIRETFSSIYNTVKERLSGVVDVVKGFRDRVVAWFHDLYMTLVGNSIVPDTVNGIVEAFASLPGRIMSVLRRFRNVIVGFFTDLKSQLVNSDLLTIEIDTPSGPQRVRRFSVSKLIEDFDASVVVQNALKIGEDYFNYIVQGFRNAGAWIKDLFSFDPNEVLVVGTAIGALIISGTLRGLALKAGLMAGGIFLLLPALGSGFLQEMVFRYTAGLVALIARAMGREFEGTTVERMRKEVWGSIMKLPEPDESAVRAYFRQVGNLLKTIGSTVVVAVTEGLFGFTPETADRLGRVFGGTLGGALAIATLATFSGAFRRGILGLMKQLPKLIATGAATTPIGARVPGGALAGILTGIFGNMGRGAGGAALAPNIRTMIMRAGIGAALAAGLMAALGQEALTLQQAVSAWVISTFSVGFLMSEGSRTLANRARSLVTGVLMSGAVADSTIARALSSRISTNILSAFTSVPSTLLAGFRLFSAAQITEFLMDNWFNLGDSFWGRVSSALLTGSVIGRFIGNTKKGIALAMAFAVWSAVRDGDFQNGIDAAMKMAFGADFEEAFGVNFETGLENAVKSLVGTEGSWAREAFDLLTSSFETAVLAALMPKAAFGVFLSLRIVDIDFQQTLNAGDWKQSLIDATTLAFGTFGLLALAGTGWKFALAAALVVTLGKLLFVGQDTEEAAALLNESLQDSFLPAEAFTNINTAQRQMSGLLSGLERELEGINLLNLNPEAAAFHLGEVVTKLEALQSKLGEIEAEGRLDLVDEDLLNSIEAFSNQLEEAIIQNGVSIQREIENGLNSVDTIQFESNLSRETAGSAKGGLETGFSEANYNIIGKGIEEAASGAINNAISQANRDMLRMQSRPLQSKPEGFANGGFISGPGGPRSDSIPAMLSNGEYVVNAAATKKFGGLLHSINSGNFQGFAGGGQVGSTTVRLPQGTKVAIEVAFEAGAEKLDGTLAGAGKAFTTAFGKWTETVNTDEFSQSLERYNRNVGIAAPVTKEHSSSTDVATESTGVLTRATNTLSEAAKKAGEETKTFAEKLAEAFGPRSEAQQEDIAIRYAQGFQNQFQAGLTRALSGEDTFSSFGKFLLDSLTNSIIDAFSSSFTDALFGEQGLNLGGLFTDMFKGIGTTAQQAGTATFFGADGVLSKIGDMLGSVFKVIGSFFGFGGFASGGIVAAANGGFISGPGGPRSDSIPEMLSNGEFVINAESTRQFRPLLEALNQGYIPEGFASGGLVESNSITALASSREYGKGDQVVVNNNITGDISRQTRQEVRRMLPEIAAGLSSYQRDRNR